MRNAFLTCLVRSSERYDIKIHAFCVLSNHFHLILTDASASPKLPLFMAALNRELAKFLNTLYRRSGAIWDSGKYSAVHLPSEAEVLDKIVYTILNPVAAGLVATPDEWPGLVTLPDDLARRRYRPRRPQLYFRSLASEAPRPSMKLTRPPSFSASSNDEYRRRVRKAVRERLEDLELTRERCALGACAVLEQSPFDQPTPKPPARTLNPRLAHRGQDKWRRIELLQALVSFRKSYREAWQRWAKGFRDVLFPEGTYGMRELHAVRCGPAPPS